MNNGTVWRILMCYHGICLEWGKPPVLESGSTIHGVDLDQASLLLGLQWMTYFLLQEAADGAAGLIVNL